MSSDREVREISEVRDLRSLLKFLKLTTLLNLFCEFFWVAVMPSKNPYQNLSEPIKEFKEIREFSDFCLSRQHPP